MLRPYHSRIKILAGEDRDIIMYLNEDKGLYLGSECGQTQFTFAGEGNGEKNRIVKDLLTNYYRKGAGS